ncbi:glutamine amidotransferase [Cellulosimicrobium marinum]|uniref:glutamine amidotransferase n=1 Tax=Cellulosimicrobium marinum TaxID=1638992 RepID=UPI001E4FEE14|nr:glutamine amidotransferase [Cellulosimicrobium marinum]MCB7136263.1 glutamine amidotransferase [Cellulosimicrobium marinum]
MKPFLLLASRAEDRAADGEHDAVLRFSGLAPDQLYRVRMEAGPLPSIDLDDYSGVIVGGSPYDSSKAEHEKSDDQRRVERELGPLLDEIVARDVPFLGACYGVGTLGLHEGAILDDTFAEPISAVTVRLTAEGRRDPLLADLPDAFEAYVGHKEAVRELPAHAVLLASSDTCPVQMFRVKENLYATQFHPELDLAGILTRIEVYGEYGYFPPETAGEVEARVRRGDVRHPGKVLAAFVRRYARD